MSFKPEQMLEKNLCFQAWRDIFFLFFFFHLEKLCVCVCLFVGRVVIVHDGLKVCWRMEKLSGKASFGEISCLGEIAAFLLTWTAAITAQLHFTQRQ